ncbi:hypothetical protein JHK87_004604 [Glycine soja]|nr:hypothetical protein JHK87_004604 [Glycine soja]
MHSATHVEAEHLLDTYSYIRDLGLDSSLEPHAVSGNMAATMTCYVATHPRLFNVSGKYFADCSETSTSKLGSNSTEAARL